MESHILKHENDRTPDFQPNRKLDLLICELKELLTPVQQVVNNKFLQPQLPVVAIVGCPRSGTTLLTQILAATGIFSYPSNLLSRFSYAPYIGILIQKLLLDPDYNLKNEFSEVQSSIGFSSDIGKTSGVLGISEFFHFWRRFFPNHDPGYLTDAELALVNVAEMRRELAAVESVSNKPFMSKAMMLQYNLAYFIKTMPEIFVVNITRDPIYTMQSIMLARRKYYGANNIWWSVKPKEYSFLKDSDFYAQVAGQVFFTEKAIADQLGEVPASRSITYRYEDLCETPKELVSRIVAALNITIDDSNMSSIEDRYECQNRQRLSEEEVVKLKQHYNNFSNHTYG